MDYWHEIVRRYDGIDPKKKSDGAYSQSSAIIILLYLSFGPDHPYNIMKFFKNPYIPIFTDISIPYSSNLNGTKIYTLLNKMKDDQLVIATRDCTSRLVRKRIFSINPRVIQSPIREGIHIKQDGSTFEIPKEMIEKFLPWRDLKWSELEPWSGRDNFFSRVVYNGNIDFYFFLELISIMAEDRISDLRERKISHQSCSFPELLKEYIKELEDYDENKNNPPRNFTNPFKKK